MSFPNFLWKPSFHWYIVELSRNTLTWELEKITSQQAFSTVSSENLNDGEQLSLGTSRKVTGSYVSYKHTGNYQSSFGEKTV